MLNYLDKSHQGDASNSQQKPLHFVHLLNMQALSVEFGSAWLPYIVEKEIETNSFLEQLPLFRKQMVEQLGFILPGIQVRDNLNLKHDQLVILLHGVPVLDAQIEPEDAGIKILFHHLETVVKTHAHEILSRDEVAVVLEKITEHRPAVTLEVMYSEQNPKGLSIGQLTQILRYLLKEQVSIRNFGLILESLADILSETTQDSVNIKIIAEALRQRLSRQINAPLATTDHVIPVITFAPELEKKMHTFLEADSTPEAHHFYNKLRESLINSAKPRILLCKPEIRHTLFSYLNRTYPDLTVLSYREISEDYRIKSVQTLSFDV